MKKRVLVCLTGASGAIYGVKLIQKLKTMGHEIHLIVSNWGEKTLNHETNVSLEELKKQVDFTYDEKDLTAGPASGSFHLDAMAIVPCSMKTLAGVAHGYANNLIGRAADCSLKERRPLVIVPRETPLNLIHIRNMETVTEAGAIVIPACPAFWHKPKSIDELVNSIVDRVIPHLGLSQTEIEWKGEI